ncbi:MAG: penicillin acylase family protein [Ferruginibacter sp.]
MSILRKLICILLFQILPAYIFAQSFTGQEITRWETQAKKITVIRDNWGIPHIYGKTDADAVFGLLYAQCEDDFKRVEMNYIEKLGRLSEVKGEGALYSDVFLKLLIDSADAVADYQKSPRWLKELLDAFAGGVNYYLYKHPGTRPALLNRFKPWYPLLWTDGSIGAISTGRLDDNDVKNFYTGKTTAALRHHGFEEATTGSNGFAIGPSKTASGNAILYINPHVTFYFRPEVHMVSEQGLNVYGAVTWGQFFIYQGFNEYCGWMHTSSEADVADIYAEQVVKQNGKWFYKYENALRPVKKKNMSIRYQTPTGILTKNITAYATHHGPVMGERNNEWLTVKANNRSLNGLIQSWQRTKAKGFEAYKKVMGLRSNTSNNTVFADNKGNIAYWHGNFMPVRDTAFDWNRPVNGTIAATEWKGLHTVDQTVHLYNPLNGWIQNCNSTPFTVAAENSPRKKDHPAYMAPDGENFRGINAVRVLSNRDNFTIDKTIAAGYDTYLAAFEVLLPALIKAFEKNITAGDSLFDLLHEPVNILKKWDYRVAEQSIATTLAIEWGEKLLPKISSSGDPGEFEFVDQVEKAKQFVATAPASDLIKPLADAVRELKRRNGSALIPWGDINRFQRISGDLNLKYNDAGPSIPVAFAASTWGMLPSYSSRYFPGTDKRYGFNGNSFICAVEFGKKVKARSLLAGGESGDPSSKHFSDQAVMYSKGKFKDVLFYKEDVKKHAEKTYRPGEEIK